jgi:Mn-dependent DtxR family transcriptional regulator
MQISALAQRLLQLVFRLSSTSNALTRPRLERRLGVSTSELNPALVELARRGLIDAQRLRLTFPGLALAVAFGARRAAKPRPIAAPTPMPRPIALFSAREAERAVA